MSSLEGKRALITGSRRGIGRATAIALARQGCDIGLNDVERDEEAEKTIAAIQALGRKVTFTVADISRADEVRAMVGGFVSEFGGIDILINNAAWAQSKPFLEIDEETYDRTMDCCLKCFFLCSQEAARAMVRQPLADEFRAVRGTIVSIASVHAYRAWPNDTVYGIAKAGVVRLTMSMALDLAEHRIQCMTIAPGYIDSRVLPPEQECERGRRPEWDPAVSAIPGRRIGLPEDIADAIVFACSKGSYVNGGCLTVDGGFLIGGTPV
jgi:NAD(P)-dependent dehydrogenase (short-subunit alcohol dehydrogenase family)